MDQVRQVAALDETPPVLITGETGTGKGLVARTLHSSGRRAGKPFIDVNCTALPANLMEAELFGYERGAFTDAKESKLGLFEAAEGGFLFLDEVGDLELSLQGKLLRAIEERTVRRVGGIRDRRIDVRILAATNRNLEREVQREPVPGRPLFPAGGDSAAPAAAPGAGSDVAAPGRTFSPPVQQQVREGTPADRRRARQALLRLSLAGERARAESRHRTGGALEPESHADRGRPVAGLSGHASGSSDGTSVVPAQETPGPAAEPAGSDLTQWERSLIERAMRESGGNQTKAAQRLGITRDTLRYRLKKFGLQGG